MSSLPKDHADRLRIVTELDRNLLVEAGAGSGKTQKLAERMAAGIANGTYDLEGMAAVTFTRKAAAELRGRFQQALEAELVSATAEDRRLRIRDALSNLERFFAGTIHSFCARLLRERPVEAGVAPGFTELDDVEDALARRQSWRDFRAEARAAGDADLLVLIEAGITAQLLDKAFERVCLYEDVTFPAADVPPPDVAPVWRALAGFWKKLSLLLPASIDDDTTCPTQERAVRFARAWRAYTRGRRDAALLADLLEVWKSKPGVTQNRWQDRPTAKKAEQLHADFRTTTLQPYLVAWRQYLYRCCVALLMKAREGARAERRRRNVLSFNDLLFITADVLRTNADVRRALQQKYRRLFVDEFQDTDPVQAEIVFLLSATDVAGTADWRTVPLRPGALFVVGDPKQSIYRFRRADIEIYNEVRARLGGPDGAGIVRLTSNFRSVPGLCDWANDLFKDRFPAAPTAHAPMFARLDADRGPGTRGPALAVLKLPDKLGARELAAEEAKRIARYIRAEVDAGNRSLGDFLILTRRKKGLRPYADALEALQVPIEVTGAGAFSESAEVRALALLLTALADPQDAVALTGVLRGPLFGLSDQDLFAFRQAGGYINIFAEIETKDEGARRVARALEALRQWYRWTRILPVGAALERVLESSGYLALAATSPDGVEAGDLLHAVDRVRAVVEDGFTFAEAADALASWCGLDDDEVEESTDVDSLPLQPGRRDVVRLMNLHKAKGLEADVVFLADPLGGWPPRVDIRIVRQGSQPVGYFQIVAESDKSWARPVLAEPPGWAEHEAAEKQYLDAELDRLLYVAATRAKDTLVVGLSAGASGKSRGAWDVLTRTMGSAPELRVPAAVPARVRDTVDLSAAASVQATTVAAAAHDRARTPSWSAISVTAETKRLLENLGTQEPQNLGTSAPQNLHDPTRALVPDTASHRADAGIAWGTLVHGLLEHAMRHPSATRDDLRRLAMWLTVEAQELRVVIDQALDTVEHVATAEFWRDARASAERHEEVPFGVLETEGANRTLRNGAIDLVYRAGEAWQVVDYKTDRDSSAGTLAERYIRQVLEYARAWERLTGAVTSTQIVSVRRSDGAGG